MNYQAFTNESLTMMYEAVRGALAADDSLEGLGEEPKFKVRDTPEWKKHAADLESEMLRRGMMFETIDWAEGQGSLPL
jgi:hypothetical protein